MGISVYLPSFIKIKEELCNYCACLREIRWSFVIQNKEPDVVKMNTFSQHAHNSITSLAIKETNKLGL